MASFEPFWGMLVLSDIMMTSQELGSKKAATEIINKESECTTQDIDSFEKLLRTFIIHVSIYTRCMYIFMSSAHIRSHISSISWNAEGRPWHIFTIVRNME